VITLDTNVIVRYLVDDDAEQAEAARALVEGLTSDSQGFICREVAIEVVWVLERFYQFTRAQIAGVLVELISTDSLVVEAADDVARAAFTYRQGGVGFSDLMILSAAERSGAVPLHTFDWRLARMEGAILVENAAGSAPP
jgi:predicted nucleic-acid-binding protein